MFMLDSQFQLKQNVSLIGMLIGCDFQVKLDTFTGGPGIQGGQPNQNYHGPGVQHQQQQQLGNLGGCLPPSRYVTISNLPEGTTQQEIIGLGIKDGKISAAHVEDMKRQGYLAFEEEHMAVQMVSRCRSSPPIHRGNQLSVSFGSAKDMKQVSNTNNSGHYMVSLNLFPQFNFL